MSAIILISFSALPVIAHEDGEPDAEWYRSLRTSGGQISCCSPDHDCFTIGTDDYRAGDPNKDEVFEAYIEGHWIGVSPRALLKRSDNPKGKPVACIGRFDDGIPYVRCFVLPAEG